MWCWMRDDRNGREVVERTRTEVQVAVGDGEAALLGLWGRRAVAHFDVHPVGLLAVRAV